MEFQRQIKVNRGILHIHYIDSRKPKQLQKDKTLTWLWCYLILIRIVLEASDFEHLSLCTCCSFVFPILRDFYSNPLIGPWFKYNILCKELEQRSCKDCSHKEKIRKWKSWLLSMVVLSYGYVQLCFISQVLHINLKFKDESIEKETKLLSWYSSQKLLVPFSSFCGESKNCLNTCFKLNPLTSDFSSISPDSVVHLKRRNVTVKG